MNAQKQKRQQNLDIMYPFEFLARLIPDKLNHCQLKL